MCINTRCLCTFLIFLIGAFLAFIVACFAMFSYANPDLINGHCWVEPGMFTPNHTENAVDGSAAMLASFKIMLILNGATLFIFILASILIMCCCETGEKSEVLDGA